MADKQGYLTIKLDEEGTIKIDTNLSGLGAMHIMASATQVIIQNQIEERKQVVEEE